MNEQLQALAAFLFILLASIFSQHADAALSLTPSVAGYSGGSFSAAAGSFSTAANAASYGASGVVSVGGKAITVPATLRMAANAGQFAKNAMRLNPWAIAGTLAAGWLLDQALEPDGAGGYTITVSPDCLGQTIFSSTGYVYSNCYRHPDSDAWWNGQAPAPVCPSPYQTFDHGGFTPSYRYCGLVVPAGTVTRPATDDDWASLPDPLSAVAPELPYAPYMPEGVPVDAPDYDFVPYSTPLGDPYTKPDGSTAQPMAKVSPNGDSITVDTYDQPLTDTNGDPVPNPTPQDTPEPNRDVCQDHPNSVMCADLGTPPVAEEVGTTVLPVDATVTPVGGAGACPASVTVAGITWSYAPMCDFASAIRPLIIGFAWLSFAYIVAGVIRS